MGYCWDSGGSEGSEGSTWGLDFELVCVGTASTVTGAAATIGADDESASAEGGRDLSVSKLVFLGFLPRLDKDLDNEDLMELELELSSSSAVESLAESYGDFFAFFLRDDDGESLSLAFLYSEDIVGGGRAGRCAQELVNGYRCNGGANWVQGIF